MRVKVVSIGVVIIFLLIAGGLLHLQLFQGRQYAVLSQKNCIRLIPQAGSRGRIVDRYGSVIVDSVVSYDVLILPKEAVDLDKTFVSLSKLLERSVKGLRDTFKANQVSSSIPVVVANNIEIKKAIALEELKLDFPGVIVAPHPLRDYPHGSLAAHIIGYLSEIDRWRLTKLEDYGYKTKDIVGFGGIEERYDYLLREENGGTSVEVDRRGRFVRVLGYQPPQNGKEIQLTLDLRLQKIVEKSLTGKKGGVVILDPFTGEVLAMASAPAFEPSIFVKQSRQEISGLFNDPTSPMLNRVTNGLYPPGSIFKAIVATAGLETGKINPSTSFLCNGEWHVGKQKFRCWSTHDSQDIISAIAHSCNVFFYRSGLLLGPQALYDYAIKFGLAKPTHIELPYEAGGYIPSPLLKKVYKLKGWYDGDTANFSIGQGDVLVTPLQMARMMAVFANKGKLVTPCIVKAIAGKDVSAFQKKATHLPFKESTLEIIRQGLRGVVDYPKGTANVLSLLPVQVAGKTGTAQAAGGPSHAWFCGFFPFKSPKYVMCVFLERGGPGYYSCLIAKQIMESMVQEGII
ncbi:MAG: penicillin-binding protein 2 [Candidatus Omnitrophota bacterium]